jgi:hypothetical protein
MLTILTVMVVLGVAAVYGPRLIRSPMPPELEAEAITETADEPAAEPVPESQPVPDQAAQDPAHAAESIDLPIPKSLKEILDSPRQLKFPKLKNGARDYVMNALYRGYYVAEPGKYRRIQIDSRDRDEHSVQIELPDKRTREWQTKKNEADVFNFNRDPYSLVFDLAGGRVIYVKFAYPREVPGYESKFRAFTGWLFDGAKAMPLALLEGLVKELEFENGQFSWPVFDSCQKIMPEPM